MASRRHGGAVDPKEAVIYTRVSSKEQQEEGYSLEAQEQLLRDYAADNGFDILKPYQEVESAKGPRRRAFNDMLQFPKKHMRNRPALLVEKTNRLYRYP